MLKFLGRLHRKFVFQRRVRVLSEILADLLPSGSQVLDVGCGDGLIDRRIAERRSDLEIRGIDVVARPDASIPVEVFDGANIPYPDGSMDVVMFVDVLHHTSDPEVLLLEGVRVARQQVILKDHLREGWLAGPTLRIMDWVGNAPHGVDLPYNYWTEQRWRESFARLGVKPTTWIDQLGLYPPPASFLFDRSLHFVASLRRD